MMMEYFYRNSTTILWKSYNNNHEVYQKCTEFQDNIMIMIKIYTKIFSRIIKVTIIMINDTENYL